jgi:hypothetical protein
VVDQSTRIVVKRGEAGEDFAMSQLLSAGPSYLAQSMFHRFSLAQYHKLTETGVLTEDDNVELIEGYVVQKMARNPPPL